MFRYDRTRYATVDDERSLVMKSAGGGPEYKNYKMTGPGWEITFSAVVEHDVTGVRAGEDAPIRLLWTFQGVQLADSGLSAADAKQLIREAVTCYLVEFYDLAPAEFRISHL